MDLKCVTISKEISISTICIQSESRGHWFMVENSTISFNKKNNNQGSNIYSNYTYCRQ